MLRAPVHLKDHIFPSRGSVIETRMSTIFAKQLCYKKKNRDHLIFWLFFRLELPQKQLHVFQLQAKILVHQMLDLTVYKPLELQFEYGEGGQLRNGLLELSC